MDSSKIDSFWEDPAVNGHAGQHLQYERNLNFSTVAVEDNEYGFPKKKTIRDPLSHRIIEKRRRDRMNNCLADLARLLPPSSLRKGRGRIEKTEIVELAIKHLRHLQCHPCPHSEALENAQRIFVEFLDNCEFNQIPLPRSNFSGHHKSSFGSSSSSNASIGGGGAQVQQPPATGPPLKPEEQFRLGFQESVSETMHFLVEQEGMYAGDDICVRLVQHLNGHCENLLRDHIGNNRKLALGFTLNTRTGKSTNGSSITSECRQPNCSGSENKNAHNGDELCGSKSLRPPLTTQSNRHGHNHASMTRQREGERNDCRVSGEMIFDFEDNNSCSSTEPLSVEISDGYSQDDKNGGVEHRGTQGKPPIPILIGSHSSSNNSGSPPVNLSSSTSDEGNSMATTFSALHRYKFKNNIKQRFNADLQTETSPYSHNHGGHHHSYYHGSSHSPRKSNQSSRVLNDNISSSKSPQTCENSRNRNDRDCFYNHDEQMTRSELSNKSKNDTRALDEQTVELQDKFHEQVTEKNLERYDKTNEDRLEKSNSSHEDMMLEPEELLEEIQDKKPALEDLIPPPQFLSASNDNTNESTKGVPAFALHEKGLFYIPLTIDKSIVSPFVAAMDQNTLSPPLHPVTISVCFLLSPDDKKIADHSTKFPIAIPTPAATSVSSMTMSSTSMTSPTEVVHAASPIMSHPVSSSSRDTTNNFIMNRFAQSQVPMLFSTGGGVSNLEKGGRYPPLSTCGHSMTSSSGGCLSVTSYFNGAESNSNSGTSNHNYNLTGGTTTSDSGSVACTNNFYSRSALDSSSGASSGRESSPTSGICPSSSKRSISVSPSISLGYCSWNEKTAGSGSDIYITNSKSSGTGNSIVPCASASNSENSEMCRVDPQHHRDGSHSKSQSYSQHHHGGKRLRKKSPTRACFMPRKYVPST